MERILFSIFLLGFTSGSIINNNDSYNLLQNFNQAIKKEIDDSRIRYTREVSAVEWADKGCESICTEGGKATPPEGCKRYAQDFDRKCKCLIAFKCCPDKCSPPVPPKCDKGDRFSRESTDCCGCKEIICEDCPSPMKLECNPACEETGYKELETSCKIPYCKKACPDIPPSPCGKCEEEEIYRNGTFCDCMQSRCLPKKCSKKLSAPLPRKSCHKIVEKFDDCGCKIQSYENKDFCKDINKETVEKQCKDDFLPSSCLKKNIRTATCGCQEAECVRHSEVCQQKFDQDAECPKGHFRKAGLTPCGLNRDICLRCEKKKLTEATCNPKCRKIVQDVDGNGCEFEFCHPKPCPVENPKCGFCDQVEMEYDDCGCPIPKCVKKCPTLDKTQCTGGPSSAFTIKDMCGCERVTCLKAPRALLRSSIGRFSIHNTPNNWAGADTYCQSKGGYLAIISSESEEDLVRASKVMEDGLSYWIGARAEIKSDTTYYWITDGKKIPFTEAPYPSKPNVEKEEGCGTDNIGLKLGKEGPWKMNDAGAEANGFICEYEFDDK